MFSASSHGHVNSHSTAHTFRQNWTCCDICGCLNHTSPICRLKYATDIVVKYVTLHVYAVMLRLKGRHTEEEDIRSEDVPFILAMEEGAVDVVSEADVQLTKFFLIHLRMTVPAIICKVNTPQPMYT